MFTFENHINLKLKFRKNKNDLQVRTVHGHSVTSLLLKPLD